MSAKKKSKNNRAEILVVEDSLTQAEQLKYILEEEGYHVLVACDGKEALSSINKHKPTIVISDIVMPEIDGYQLSRHIKADENLKEIPIILLTALSDPKDVIRGLECGADNFIVKPYDEKYLLSRVQYILTNLDLRKKERTQMGVEIIFAGRKYFITSERQQILDLLLSTYETAVQKNYELIKVQDELRKLNEQLEEKVKERTSSLESEITERKRTEEALKYEKDKLIGIFEAMEDGIGITNQQYELEYLNPTLIKEFGPLGGRKCYEYFHDRKEVCPWCLNQEVFAGKTVRWEWYSFKNQKTYDLIGTPLRNPDGTISKLEIFRDVTEHKQVEKEILRRNREISVLYTIDYAASQSLNLEEILSAGLDATLKALDIEAGGFFLLEPDGKTMTLRLHHGVSDEFVKNVQRIKLGEGVSGRAAAEKKPVVLDVADYPTERLAPFIIQEGIQTLASTPLLSGGKLVGAMNLATRRPHAFPPDELELLASIGMQLGGVIHNAQLYEVVQQELAERKRAEEVLKQAEEKFRELFDNAPVGYHEYDAKGRITSINRTKLEMMGYSREEVVGQPIWKFVVEEEEARRSALDKLAGTTPPGWNFERTYRRKDGTTFPALIQDRILRDPEGKITGMRCAIQDITSLKRAEEAVRQTEEQFRQSQKMEAIGRLAGGIAHDFNNLLTIIKGYSQFSLLDLKESDPMRRNIEEIQKATQRAEGLTRQILAFSRRQVLEVKVLDLNGILRDLDKMLRRVIGEDIDLVTMLAENLGRVKTDPGQIEQVIMNLAVNAKYAMLSGGKLTIETANVELDEAYARNHVAVIPGCYVMLSVSDTGVGMTPEVKERVFEPFFTTKERDKGTGLGLSTVYGIVKQSGGNIWVYSEPGKGTTFKIYLPRVDEPLEELKEKTVTEELPRGSETVLVVEDEEEVRKLAVRILERQGYRILEASQGIDAFLICEEHEGPIHLLVTDVVMPKIDGRELAGRLSSIRPEIKVLYMSGYTDNAIVHHGVLGKGMNYIQKPFTVIGLARKVREVLDR